MGKSSNWNSEAMQESLISDMKQEIEQGGEKPQKELPTNSAELPTNSKELPTNSVATPAAGSANIGTTAATVPQPTAPTAVIIPPAQAPKEPTKGIQTDVPMSLYQRLVMAKLRRGEPICSMMIQALRAWLDAEEKAMQVGNG